MEILSNLGGVAILTAFLVFSYIGIHMVFEKDAKKHIPLIWEEGGILYNLFNRKSK